MQGEARPRAQEARLARFLYKWPEADAARAGVSALGWFGRAQETANVNSRGPAVSVVVLDTQRDSGTTHYQPRFPPAQGPRRLSVAQLRCPLQCPQPRRAPAPTRSLGTAAGPRLPAPASSRTHEPWPQGPRAALGIAAAAALFSQSVRSTEQVLCTVYSAGTRDCTPCARRPTALPRRRHHSCTAGAGRHRRALSRVWREGDTARGCSPSLAHGAGAAAVFSIDAAFAIHRGPVSTAGSWASRCAQQCRGRRPTPGPGQDALYHCL